MDRRSYTMTRARIVPVLFAPIAAMAFVLAPADARAQSACNATTDCPKGYLCTAMPAACPAIACAPNTACTQPVCTDVMTKQCVVGATCTSDADCSAELKCAPDPATPCAGVAVACKAGETCLQPPQPVCPPAPATSSCQPRASLPCQLDADCGEGFACTQGTDCSCSGSGGTAPTGTTGTAGGASSEPMPPVAVDAGSAPSCTCFPSGTSYCRVIDKICVAASDCPSGWTCEQTMGVGCATPVDPTTGVSAPCDPGPQPPKQCVPPYNVYGGGASEAPRSANGSSGTGGTAGVATTLSGPAPAPAAAQDPGGGASCSVGRASDGLGLAWLAALGAAVASVRRRRVTSR
jgi:hypothetical protein